MTAAAVRLRAIVVPRRVLAVVAAALLLTAGYMLWLRDSSLVAVDDVTVTGLTTKDAERLRAALTGTARDMTTLHVDHERLEDAAAGYSVVSGIEVETDFPHGMTIRVIEHVPAAMATGPGGRVPVAGDGTVLKGLPIEGELPQIRYGGGLEGDRLADPKAVAAARVAGAAPAELRPKLEDARHTSDRGIVVRIADGPELIFGDAARASAKWIAATRVLADASSGGASYVDVRLPERPAAGGLPAATVAPVDAQPEVETLSQPQAPLQP